jgi:hypothetical protein
MAFGKHWGSVARVTSGPSLAAALPATQQAPFLDALEKGLSARFASEPEPMIVWYARLVLEKVAE